MFSGSSLLPSFLFSHNKPTTLRVRTSSNYRPKKRQREKRCRRRPSPPLLPHRHRLLSPLQLLLLLRRLLVLRLVVVLYVVVAVVAGLVGKGEAWPAEPCQCALLPGNKFVLFSTPEEFFAACTPTRYFECKPPELRISFRMIKRAAVSEDTGARILELEHIRELIQTPWHKSHCFSG